MNILYTLNSGNPGGMEQHVLDLVTGMVSRKHKVYVWCAQGTIVNWFKQAGAEVITKSIKFDVDPIYIYHLSNFLREKHIDVIHAHELKAVTNGLLAGFLAETKVRVSHTHTPISEWTIEKYKKAYDFVKVFGYANLIKLFGTVEIALTESRKQVKAAEGIPESKLKIIPNAVNAEQFDIPNSKKQEYRKEILTRHNIPDDAFVFGFVGRISREKGHDVLINAFSSLVNLSFPDKDKVYLLIAGGGELEAKMKSLVTTLGLDERVKITGVFPKEDSIKYYASFDAFVFPSRTEGFGIVLIEAMASGLPCICSDLPVLQEVGGSLCLYFESENSESLKQRMLDIYSRRENLSNLKIGSRERVEQLYTLTKFIDAYETLYSGYLENNK